MDIQTNGGRPEPTNSKPPETPEALAVKNAVDYHVTSYKKLEIERDEYKVKLETAEKLIAVYKIEIEGYRAQAAAESNRTVSYQHERDESVSRYAALERTVDDIYAIILRSKADAPEV